MVKDISFAGRNPSSDLQKDVDVCLAANNVRVAPHVSTLSSNRSTSFTASITHLYRYLYLIFLQK